MISKTKIGKRIGVKKDFEIVETILLAKKNESWNKLAQLISGSRRKYLSVNLKEIDKKSSEGDTVVVAGKVLGVGGLTKKVKICAIGFSKSAKEKLKDTKTEMVMIADEIKKNPKAEGIKFLR